MRLWSQLLPSSVIQSHLSFPGGKQTLISSEMFFAGFSLTTSSPAVALISSTISSHSGLKGTRGSSP